MRRAQLLDRHMRITRRHFHARAADLARMRASLNERLLAIRDTGFLPEPLRRIVPWLLGREPAVK